MKGWYQMSRQALIEYVLDRWVSSTDLKFIRDNYRGFYNDPVRYKNLAGLILDDLGVDNDAWDICVNM